MNLIALLSLPELAKPYEDMLTITLVLVLRGFEPLISIRMWATVAGAR